MTIAENLHNCCKNCKVESVSYFDTSKTDNGTHFLNTLTINTNESTVKFHIKRAPNSPPQWNSSWEYLKKKKRYVFFMFVFFGVATP
jgi:hypothetical protein